MKKVKQNTFGKNQKTTKMKTVKCLRNKIKLIMKPNNKLTYFIVIVTLSFTFLAFQRSSEPPKILVDVGHGQRFWKDPMKLTKTDKNINRVEYMTKELEKSIAQYYGEIDYVNEEIQSSILKNIDILFIHIPSTKYSEKEIYSIQKFVRKGGSLFITMDIDYWSTLNQTNVNDILKPFEIEFEGEIPDSISGGYTTKGKLHEESLKIPYHGGRIIKGGIPFCYRNLSKNFAFGVYKELKKGKIVVMGDGMASLYMTSWQGVNDYQSQEFMRDVFSWLLD